MPGARYVHLDDDLSGPKTGGNGRHPLPDRGRVRARPSARWASAPDTPGGASTTPTAAACTRRAPGGCCAGSATTRWRCSTAAWRRGGRGRRARPRRPVEPLARRRRSRRGRRHGDASIAAEVAAARRAAGHVLVDARAAERFRGENETARPGGRPHPRRGEPLLPGQSRRRRDASSRRRDAARRVGRRCSAAATPASGACTAARASPPATTCWRWSTPACPAPGCSTPARGASGAPTPRGRSPPATDPGPPLAADVVPPEPWLRAEPSPRPTFLIRLSSNFPTWHPGDET